MRIPRYGVLAERVQIPSLHGQHRGSILEALGVGERQYDGAQGAKLVHVHGDVLHLSDEVYGAANEVLAPAELVRRVLVQDDVLGDLHAVHKRL